MSTKNNPGKWDCYAKAEPDEPMFILLGRDPLASMLVAIWAQVQSDMGKTDFAKLENAFETSKQMVIWAREKKSPEQVVEALVAFEKACKVIVDHATANPIGVTVELVKGL